MQVLDNSRSVYAKKISGRDSICAAGKRSRREQGIDKYVSDRARLQIIQLTAALSTVSGRRPGTK